MTVEDIIKLIENSNTPDFGPKNWQFQPAYFQKILKNVDISKYKNSLFIELGVFTGFTLNLINQNTEDITVYGFDTFSGLPEDWAESSGNILYTKNAFNTSIPEDTAKNKFIVGKIEDTLSNFLKEKNQKIRFIHLDLDLYSASKYAFDIIFDWLEDEAIIVIDDVYGLPSWEKYSIKSLADSFNELKYEVEPIATCGWKDGWASMALKVKRKDSKTYNKTTIVTGLWDLKRGDIDGWGKRDFQQYKDRFFELLQSDAQMCIWIPKELEQEVLKVRGDKPTQIYFKELEDFKTWFPFFDKLQEIRTSPKWVNFAGWLAESPQGALEFYNPMMMCKMFMVNDSALFNPFDSNYFYWIDGGLTSTVSQGYFIHDNVLDNLQNYTDSIDKFTFIQYPYTSNEEIHGFERKKMAEYCEVDFVDKISRGGFWGGTKEQIHKINNLYYSILYNTINEGYMGADECLFTILSYQNPELINNFEVEGNGLVWPFFENLKQYTKSSPKPQSKIGLYVITYNSPKQFKTLIESMLQYDSNFVTQPQKFLLDNSLNLETQDEYLKICKEYNFTHIKKDNIGICGGRQFIAEHAHELDLDAYFFFEDDMFFYPKEGTICRNGFNRKVNNLYYNSIKILNKEKFDFLKLSYSEFYGDNGKQWAWYNVPQSIRDKYFPEYNKLPNSGIDINSPSTQFNTIGSLEGIPYISGEIYYSNWPQIVSKDGNKKMFLDTKWEHPFEQTWMSHMFQETKNNNIKPGLLLLTPTEHDRFDHYKAEERREN
jgi:hypothetical protein